MAKVLDKIDNTVFVRLSVMEYEKLHKIWIFDDNTVLDFKELENFEITKEIKESINETRKIKKTLLCNL